MARNQVSQELFGFGKKADGPSIADSIKRLREHDASKTESFNRPASMTEVGQLYQQLQRIARVTLPSELKEILRIANGGMSFLGGELMSTKDILSEFNFGMEMLEDGDWERPSKPAEGISEGRWWEPHWIPFVAVGNGDYLCIDVKPGSGGNKDQVISWRHDSAAREVLAPSLSAYVAQCVDEAIGDGKEVAQEAMTFRDAFGDIFANWPETKTQSIAQEFFKPKGPKVDDHEVDTDEFPKYSREMVIVSNPNDTRPIAAMIKTINVAFNIIHETRLNDPVDPKLLTLLKRACEVAKIKLPESVVQLYQAADGQGDNANLPIFPAFDQLHYFAPLRPRDLKRWLKHKQEAEQEGKKLDFVPISFIGKQAYIGVSENGKVVTCDDEGRVNVIAPDLRKYMVLVAHRFTSWASEQQKNAPQ